MSTISVPIENAIPVRRCRGSIVTFINQSGVDVFFDTEPSRLNSTSPGTTPLLGTKLTANGGEKEFKNYPGVIWFRAPIATTVEVQS